MMRLLPSLCMAHTQNDPLLSAECLLGIGSQTGTSMYQPALQPCLQNMSVANTQALSKSAPDPLVWTRPAEPLQRLMMQRVRALQMKGREISNDGSEEGISSENELLLRKP